MAIGNGVTVVVDAQNKTAQAFGEAAKGAKTVGDAAAIADKQLNDMGARLDQANVKARKLAEAEERSAAKTRDMIEKLQGLKRQLAEGSDESGKLSAKIERLTIDTRSAANATDDYRRSAGRAAAEAREQARAYDRVADNARQAARAVALLGASAILSPRGSGGKALPMLNRLLGLGADGAASGISGALGGLKSAGQGIASTPYIGPAALAAGATAAIPAATFAGAAIGGGILAGGGAAAAGGGLAGAWMGDPDKFDAMWSASIDKVEGRWLSSSKAFTNELEDGLKIVDRTLEDLPVEKILALSQSFVKPLTEGASSGITALADGFADSLERAQPAVDAVGDGLANIGAAGGDAFRMVAQGSEGGAHAIGDLSTAIAFAVQATGLMILGFENAYEKIRDFESANFDFIAQVPVVGSAVDSVKDKLFNIAETTITAGRALHDAGDAAYSSSTGIGSWAAAAAEAQVNAMALNDALAETHSQMLNMANSNVAVAQGWIDLNKGLLEGKRTLDLSTQAGVDNQEVILSQIGLLERQRVQAIATGGDTVEATEAANAAYAAQVEKIRAAAVAAGFDKGEVDKLIGSLGAIPPNPKSNVTVTGLAASLEQGISLGNALNRIDGKTYEANVYTNYHTRGQALNAPLVTGGIPHAATGGGQSGLTMTSENGPELLRLPTGTMVYPNANAMQAQTMAGWGAGGGSGGLVLLGSDGSQLGDALIGIIALEVEARGGRPELLGIRTGR